MRSPAAATILTSWLGVALLGTMTAVKAADTTSPVTSTPPNSALTAIAQMPPCAISCLMPALKDSGCALTDSACICGNEKFKATVMSCVLKTCTIKEALVTMNSTATACNLPIRNRTNQYITISNTFGIITAVFVTQRFLYKFFASIEYGLDDWFTLATTIIGVPVTVINAHGVTANGLGKDIWTLSHDSITTFVLYFYILEILYFTAVTTVKLALLFFYIRIFPSQGVKKLLYGTVIVDVLFGVSFTVIAIFQCTPVDFYWNKWDGEHQGKCMNVNALAWSNAAISIALDVWMLGIPLWQLQGLNLHWKKKLSVAMMFCVGTFITVVSILRLKSLVNFGSDTLNPTWDFFDVGIWSTVEINVGIICVCMPAMRLMLVRLFPRLRGTTNRSYGNGSASRKTLTRRPSRPLNEIKLTSNNNTSNSFSKVESGGGVNMGRQQQHPKLNRNGIICHKTFDIGYENENENEHDEMHLVHMKHPKAGDTNTSKSRWDWV